MLSERKMKIIVTISIVVLSTSFQECPLSCPGCTPYPTLLKIGPLPLIEVPQIVENRPALSLLDATVFRKNLMDACDWSIETSAMCRHGRYSRAYKIVLVCD